jgi:4-amino-4-deoxy-L-arabinose transferase-like glycosyltransferase
MKPNFFQSTRGLMLLGAIVVASLFVNLDGVPLFDEDEGAYAEVTREMLESGDFLTPRLEGKPFFHKPPMIYWAQVLSVRLLGLNEFAFRLPSALASLAWAAVLFHFVRRFVGRQQAWFAPFFLVTALQTSIIAKAAIVDALLNLFITLTMFAIYHYFNSGRRRHVLLAYAFMALGFLTKGPVAVAIPAVVSLLYGVFQRRFRDWALMVFYPVGWALFIIIALPWYIALIASYGWSFIQEIILVHNLGRFQGAMEGHSGPIYYYLPVILIGLLPYTPFLFVAFSEIRQHWREKLGKFLVLWFLFVLVLFSLAGTKLHHYIVYGYVPLLILMARSVSKMKSTGALLAPTVAFLVLLWMIPWMASWAAPYIHDDFAKVVIDEALGDFGNSYRLIVGLVLVVVIVIGLLGRIGLPSKTVAVGILLLLLVNGYLMPKLASIMQNPIRTAALMAKEKDYSVVMWQMNKPSFNIYYGRQVLRRIPRSGDVVITKANKLKDIKDHQVLFEKYGIVLTKVNALK